MAFRFFAILPLVVGLASFFHFSGSLSECVLVFSDGMSDLD